MADKKKGNDLQDQIDILATNLEVLNQKLHDSPSKGSSMQALPDGNASKQLTEIHEKITGMITKLSGVEAETKQSSKSVSEMHNALTELRKGQKLIEQYEVKIAEHSSYTSAQVSKLQNVLSSLSKIEAHFLALDEIKTRVQSVEDLVRAHKEMMNETQSRTLYLEKLSKHGFSELHKQIRQLPFEPVTDATKRTLTQFPEDSERKMMKSVLEEIKSSKKEFPLLFAFVVIFILLFSIQVVGLFVYLIVYQ